MIDSVQLILLLVIIILTLLLVVLGVQVFLILKDLRQTIGKANKILDTTDAITEGIQGPLSAVSSLVLGVKASSLLTVARFVKNFLGHDKDGEKRHRRE
ncbi:MAG TPA: hypothetical protein VE090_06705 [Methylomirabilota bacterium]|nr:hypothetical protein [Methylomirabilota bacterium]